MINPVNCVGVMGKGLALQFKRSFPDNFRAYKQACSMMEVRLGRMYMFATGLPNPRYIINFPTKRHWRDKSWLNDIAAGLKDLASEVRRLDIESIAVPPLGCGLGGLEWPPVRRLIESAFQYLPDVRVLLYEPQEKL